MFWLKDGGHTFIALHSYFDGSYTGPKWTEGRFITLAGCATDDSIWADIEQGWQAVLDEDSRRPRAKYLHMKQATKGLPPFDWKNGWNATKVWYLITDCLMYINGLDKERFRQFACTLDLDAYRRAIADGIKLDDPITICNVHCPFTVLLWYGLKYPGIIHSAHYFFDESEPFKAPFEEMWANGMRDHLSIHSISEYWSLIKTVTTARMQNKPGLQMADLLAWSATRKLTTQDGDLAHHLSDVLRAITPSSWVIWDEKKLRCDYRRFRDMPSIGLI